MARLLDQYTSTIAPGLAQKFNLTNKMAIPKLEKIVINMGVGRATQDKAPETHAWGRIAHMADPFGHGFCLIQFVGRGYDEVATQ